MLNRSNLRMLAVALATSTTLGACAGAGNLGNVLGDVLGGMGGGQQQAGQVQGTIIGVDTRAQAIGLQTTNGQQVNLLYDANTQVIFENRNYPPTALERGDRVTARVQQVSQGYYTDVVQVTQSVSGSAGSSGTSVTPTGSVQQLEGTVQNVSLADGSFTLGLQGYGIVTVTLPYNASRTEIERFQRLRRGQNIRFYGVFINQTRIELRQFI